MSLKEELSLDRKRAIEEQEQEEAKADAEMRIIIEKVINPIIKLMHQQSPTQKVLAVTMENRGTMYFEPKHKIVGARYPEYYNSNSLGKQLISAAYRVGSEFDFDVHKKDDNESACVFEMTLDD